MYVYVTFQLYVGIGHFLVADAHTPTRSQTEGERSEMMEVLGLGSS